MDSSHLMDLGGGVGFFGTLLIGVLAGWIAEKITRDSSKKVDLAVCMVGARMGRRLALNSGKVRTKRRSGRAAF